MSELVVCVRSGDVSRVKELLADLDTSPNQRMAVTQLAVVPSGTPTPYTPDKEEGPLYDSFALFEAARSSHDEMIGMLLERSDLDVNQRATKANVSTLADAVGRGDIDLVRRLLDDSRVDHTAGSDDIATPLLFAVHFGHADIVDMFLSRGLATFDEEAALKAEAESNGDAHTIEALRVFFLTKRDFSSMDRPEQLERLRHEFQVADKNSNGSIDLEELVGLAKALEQDLSSEEASEALVAMDTDGDSRVTVEELIVFWLGTPLGDDE